jgi:hypothetical protein
VKSNERINESIIVGSRLRGVVRGFKSTGRARRADHGIASKLTTLIQN